MAASPGGGEPSRGGGGKLQAVVGSRRLWVVGIMSGRKAIDVQHSPPSVVEWAVPLLRKGRVTALFDSRVAPPGTRPPARTWSR